MMRPEYGGRIQFLETAAETWKDENPRLNWFLSQELFHSIFTSTFVPETD